MNSQAGSDIVGAFLSGNTGLAVKLILVFAVVNYGAYAIAQALRHMRDGINWLRGKANELPLLAATQLDDRFFDLLEKATANQVHLQEATKTAFADGNLTQEDIKGITEAIWADFKANTGVTDLSSFAMAMLGNASAPGAERALRAKFDANVHRFLGTHLHESSSRRMQRGMARAQMRALQGPGLPPV